MDLFLIVAFVVFWVELMCAVKIEVDRAFEAQERRVEARLARLGIPLGTAGDKNEENAA
ncbi:MAG: hypothetical protein K2X45_07935 [Phreatobacter sp.]|nr:hypothetical protein [Phreatobacter sp.]